LRHIVDRILGKTPGPKRSRLWRKVRKAFIKKNPFCANCGGTKKLEVHHIVPFHEDFTKELDHDNLIVLCSRKKKGVHCHLYIGHRGNYKLKNENVIDMAGEMLNYLNGDAS
jgi:5-methylcytosine-specific restriction endonuclease McrA